MSIFFEIINLLAVGMLAGAVIAFVYSLFERKHLDARHNPSDHRVHIILEDETGRRVEREADSVSAVPGIAEEAARELARSEALDEMPTRINVKVSQEVNK